MVDDLLAVAPCNQRSVALNTFINVQIELKKLKFHTPDENGKTKCHVLHIGKENKLCPTLQVHGTSMIHVTEDTYLGDIISSDGRNTKNITSRIHKGHGKITEIMTILETTPLGPHYFKTALLLRESLFLNSILTNADIWVGLTNEEIKQFEDLDLILMRKFLKTPFSVPAEAVYLELGCLNIGTMIKARRCNYLHYLVKQSETSMLKNFFMAQWKYPTMNDWTEQVKKDLIDFDLPIELDLIKARSTYSFNAEVKRKSIEYAFFSYLAKKEIHSKLDNLFYRELSLQNYFYDDDISCSEAQVIFSFRTRMSNFSENYPGKDGIKVCPLCQNHQDLQKFSFQCSRVLETVEIRGNYSNIFSENIKLETVRTIEQISKFRTEYIQERTIT
jgi:hypothetical protein